MAGTADLTELRLLHLQALSAGEQALRKQLRADQEDPENKHAQASVTRRVGAQKAVWQREKEYNDFTASILRSLQGPYREFFIRNVLGKEESEEDSWSEAVSRSRSPRTTGSSGALRRLAAPATSSSSARPGEPSSSSSSSRPTC